MKNLYLPFLSICLFFLVSCNCCNIDSNKSTYEISTNPSSANTTNVVSEYISPFSTYKSYSQNTNIDLMLNSNPIDKKYIMDEKILLKQSSYDELEFVRTYINIWDNEMNTIMKNLQTKLDGETLNTLNDSQIEWVKFMKSDCNLATQIQLDTAGTGSIIPILDTYKYLDAVRHHTLVLAEYYYMKTGEFQFVFH